MFSLNILILRNSLDYKVKSKVTKSIVLKFQNKVSKIRNFKALFV